MANFTLVSMNCFLFRSRWYSWGHSNFHRSELWITWDRFGEDATRKINAEAWSYRPKQDAINRPISVWAQHQTVGFIGPEPAWRIFTELQSHLELFFLRLEFFSFSLWIFHSIGGGNSDQDQNRFWVESSVILISLNTVNVKRSSLKSAWKVWSEFG